VLTSTIYFDKIIITKNIDKEMYVKMKSRKFKAVLAAISAIAVLATAMTGFAATITTVTTYNLSTDKASVTTTVAGLTDTDAEVTLLVSAPGAGVNGSGISYIDQKAASDGTAEFTYQLDKAALSDATAAVVTSGNDANEGTVTGDLGVEVLNDVDEEMYTITYTEDAYGAGDETVNVAIAAKTGYEITDVKVAGVSRGKEVLTFAVDPTAVITVDAQAAVTGPSITAEYITVGEDNGVYNATAIIQVSGNYTEVGVSYKGFTFPATGEKNANNYVAVKLTNDTAFVETDVDTYIEE